MSTALATLAGKLAERVGMDSVDPQGTDHHSSPDGI